MNTLSKRQKLTQWLDERTALPTAIRRRAESTLPGGAWLMRTWPSMILLVFAIQVISGLVLWMYYSPSAQTAWESVYYIQYEVTGGWLVRGIHHYAAQVLVALAGLYVVQLVLAGSYRRPREFVFWVAVFLVLTSLGLCLTGDLLAWDQNRFTATQTRVNFLMLIPWIGSYLYRLAAGGSTFGHLTLARFFALHVGVFAAAMTGLLVLHAWVVYRAAQAAGPGGHRTAPYWPRQFVRNAVAGLVVVAVILVLVFQRAWTADPGRPVGEYLGAELGPPADPDPASASAAARPEWSFRALYALTHAFPGRWQFVPVFVIPGLLTLYVLAMPLVGRWPVGHWLNVFVLVGIVAGSGYLTWKSYRADWQDPAYRAAVADQQAKARRVVELARFQGIPPSGALALMRADPKLQGPKLFHQHCAACHTYTPPDGQRMGPDEPAAPELYGFATPDWVAGLLHPEHVASSRYFGNTRFAGGVMAKYVQGHAAGWDEDTRRAVAMALADEAQLVAGDEERIRELVARGRELIIAEGCTRCHRFGEHGVPGDAPDLTGYGSHEWLAGIIADPAHGWFYGVRNDRMPAYIESLETPIANRLSFEQLDALVRWLRGQWYEPGAAEGRAAPEVQAVATVAVSLGRWDARRLPAEPEPTDPKGRAWAAYKLAQCHLCHDCTDPSGEGIKARQPVAPNLYRFASRGWLEGLLDPAQVAGPRYFGTSEYFKNGSMVRFVKEELAQYISEAGSFAAEEMAFEAAEEGQEVAFALKYLTGLKAEIGEEALRQQAANAAKDDEFPEFVLDNADDEWLEQLGRQRLAELIEALAAQSQGESAGGPGEETEVLFEDFGCSECHKFYSVGDGGEGPDLTGYGSDEWLAQLLSDPEGNRFYPETNQGMPAYRAFPDQPQRNLLTMEQIQMIADLIRGRLDPSGSSPE